MSWRSAKLCWQAPSRKRGSPSSIENNACPIITSEPPFCGSKAPVRSPFRIKPNGDEVSTTASVQQKMDKLDEAVLYSEAILLVLGAVREC
jgi:hypothetical protein